MDGKRLCCLFIPDFPLQVQVHHEGLDPEKAVVIISHPPGQASTSRVRIQSATLGAKAAGITVGMSLAEAEIQCPTLIILHEQPKLYHEASDVLLAALCHRFPSIEGVEPGLFYVGLKGLSLLYRDEITILKALGKIAEDLKYRAWATAAANRFTALAWAKAHGVQWVQDAPLAVPSGLEGDYLASLPLRFLPEPGDLPERLAPLGISTLGDFARLDNRAVERRYGKDGIRLHRLARGEDSCHITPVRAPQDWQDHLHLDAPVYQAQGLLFLMGPILEELMRYLQREGRALQSLRLTFHLEGKKEQHLDLHMAAPTEQTRVVQDLLHLKLTKLDLRSGVIAFTLRFTNVTEPVHAQAHLFERRTSATGMAATLARLRDTLGQHTISHAQPHDAYLPTETYRLAPAAPIPGKKITPTPPNTNTPALTLRQITPPRPLDVKIDPTGTPKAIRLGQTLRQTLWSHGPMHYQGKWWTPTPFSRLYYRLWLQGPSEILIYLDQDQDQWYLEGVYD